MTKLTAQSVGFPSPKPARMPETLEELEALSREIDTLAGQQAAKPCAVFGAVAKFAPQGLELEDLGDLLDKPSVPVDWLVEGLLVAGSVSIEASKPKVGKSTLTRYLILCVARGEPFLERETKRGEVIYLVLEERKEDVTEAFRAMGATPNDPIKITGQGSIPQLVTTLMQYRPALLVIDPLFRLLSVKDEKSYAEVYGQMGALIDVARQTGTHILCLHHSPKQAREEAIDAPLGSTALGGAVSTLIELRRNPESGMRTIRTTQRIGEDLEEMVLRFEPGTKGFSLEGTRQQFEVNNLKPLILTAINGAEMTENEIFGIVEHGKTGAKRTALRELCRDGLLERLGTGKKASPFLYRNSRSHVPHYVPNRGNENPAVIDREMAEMLVPTTSLL